MSNSSNKNSDLDLQRIVELLKFILVTDDPELTRSTIESIIEILEEKIN